MSQSRASKVIALSFGQGLTGIFTLLSGIALARLLSKGELATYRQTLLAYNIAVPILSLGLSSGLYFFLPNEVRRVRGIVVDALLLMFLMGGLYAAFIAFGGNHLLAKRFSNPEIMNTLLYMIPYPMVTLPAGLISAVLVVRGKVAQLSAYNVLSNFLLGLGVVGACFLWKSPQKIIITNVAISSVFAVIAIAIMLRAVPKDSWHPRLYNMKSMAAYSLPLSLASMMGSIALQLDKFIVSAMRSPEEFAVYSNGAVEIPLIGVITGAITTVILADMAGYCKQGKKDKALELFKTGAARSGLILLPTMAFLMIYADEFIIILFSEKYRESVGVFRIYLGVLPIRIVMYGAALMALNMTRVILWRSIGDLAVNAILSCLFVYFWGPYGAAYATVLTLMIWTVPFNLHMISRGFERRWYEILPLRHLGKIVAIATVAAVVGAIGTAVVDFNIQIMTFCFGGLIFAVVYCILSYKFIVESRFLMSAFLQKFMPASSSAL